MPTIGEKIKKVRNERNLSQRRFGEKVGLSSKTISAYERGLVTPPLHILERISEIFNVTLFELPSKKRSNLINKVQDLESALSEIKSLLNLTVYE